MKPLQVAVLDIEARSLVSDWSRPWLAGVASVAVWCNWLGGSFGKTFLFDGGELPELHRLLQHAELLCTYNGERYDMPALAGCFGGPVYKGYHCDLHARLYGELGHRVSLEKVAQATLGRGKSGSGAHAPEMYQAGQFAQLHTYNMDDVDLTRDLFLFARRHGFLWVPDGNGKRKAVPVDVLPMGKIA